MTVADVKSQLISSKNGNLNAADNRAISEPDQANICLFSLFFFCLEASPHPVKANTNVWHFIACLSLFMVFEWLH